MVHLRIADKFLDELKDIDETAFVLGNIAPDSGVPNEDWSVFTPPKNVTHFKTDPSNDGFFDVAEFCRQYFSDDKIRHYSKKEYSFFLGYYVHLLTDIEWTEKMWEFLSKNYHDEFVNNKSRLVWTAKEDWYDIDFLYLHQHPDFRAFSIYENAVNYDNEFMDIFSRDAFENRRQYICGYYRSDNHGELFREYEYLTPEEAEEFVEVTVRKILRDNLEKSA